MSDNMNVGVIGLGSMGFGMAHSLVRAGHKTFGFDVNPAAVARFQAAGGAAGEFAQVAQTLDAVVVVVLNAAQTEAVLFGTTGIAPHLKPGTVIIACPTVSPEFAREMESRCIDAGLLYLDAPISGGVERAAAGKLSIMAAGSAAAFAAARPVIAGYSETVFELGDSAGPGSAMKAVNQLLAGVHLATMAEALTFGMTQGVSPEMFYKIIPKCAGTSWMVENRTSHIVEGDYTTRSAVDIWPKDLGIIMDIARKARFSAPIAAAALQQFLAASGMGLGLQDDAAIAKLYARNAGLTLPGDDA